MDLSGPFGTFVWSIFNKLLSRDPSLISLIPQQPLYLLGPLFAISLWTVKPTFRRERELIQLKTQVPGESLENVNSDDYYRYELPALY